MLHLRDLKLMASVPQFCNAWLDLDNKESTMYGEDMRSLSAYEIENCPWWIDMPPPNVLPRERQKFDTWKIDTGKDKVQEGISREGKTFLEC